MDSGSGKRGDGDAQDGEGHCRSLLHRSANALPAPERLLTNLLDSLAGALLVVRIPGYQIEYANGALSNVVGYEAKEVIGREIRILYPARPGPSLFEELVSQSLIEKRHRFRGEQVLVKKNGDLVWAEIVATLVYEDGQLSQVISIIRDITDSKLADEVLLRSQSRLELLNDILRGMQAGMSVEQMIELTLQRISERFTKFRVAYSRVEGDEIVVTHSIEPEGMPPLEGRSADLKAAPEYLDTLRRGEAVIVEDTARDSRLGELSRTLEAGGARAMLNLPMHCSNEVMGLLCLDSPEPRKWGIHEIDTITEVAGYLAIALRNVQAREERQRLEGQLRQAQKMEAVGRLAGGVAHDFNNILTGITGYTELALCDVEDGSLREDLMSIREFSDRAAQLTQQLLAFSRRQPLEPVVLDLNKLISNTISMLARLISEDIELEFAPAEDIGNVKVDAGQIEQVLMNLAINARDAMPDGGKLLIETAEVTLDDGYAGTHTGVVPGAYVMLAVTDTGCGMDEECKRQIFEPFFTTKEKGKGTGLGLATVYGIVKQHGGNVWVYSEPGKGTTFKIYLPRLDHEVEAIPACGEPVSTLRGSETILLVEDESSVGDAVGRALESYGYKVISAAHPDRAFELFSHSPHEIRLLLTDVVLPSQDGRELYERMREQRPDLRVLYMSGYTDGAILHNGVLDPGVPFVQKPFAPAQLVGKIRALLDKA
ncbi:MAG: ATP-binding protein [Acidobacteriota bacterium]